MGNMKDGMSYGSNVGHREVRVGLTCCRARCQAARCGRKAREAYAHRHTREAPTATCSRTTTAPPTSSSSLSGSLNSETKQTFVNKYAIFSLIFFPIK